MFPSSFMLAAEEELSLRGQATEWGQKKHQFLAKRAVAMPRKSPENENYFQFTFQAEGLLNGQLRERRGKVKGAAILAIMVYGLV